jgi:hypothetical protein
MNIFKKDKRTNLEKEIDSVIFEMSTLNPADDKYAIMADNLEKLLKMKSCDKKATISPDTIAIIAGNLLGIILILGYEKANVITSKALGFVLKGRV